MIMKSIFIFAAFAVAILLCTIPAPAQQVQPASPEIATDSLSTIKLDSVLASVIKTDSLKTTKKKKQKKRLRDTTAYNPYPTNNAVVKPPSYNSYRENPKPLEKSPLPMGEIIRDIVVPKKNN
jgi:hypothetical protein